MDEINQFADPDEEEQTEPCPDCNGTGEDQRPHSGPIDPCFACLGTGRVSTKPPEPPDDWADNA